MRNERSDEEGADIFVTNLHEDASIKFKETHILINRYKKCYHIYIYTYIYRSKKCTYATEPHGITETQIFMLQIYVIPRGYLSQRL